MSQSSGAGTTLYYLRRIPFKGEDRAVVLQINPGPCPILAIFNVLSLRGQVHFHPSLQCVSFRQIIDLLLEFLQKRLETLTSASDISEETLANLLKNFEEVSAALPRFEDGLDVNVMFDGVSRFEFTPEIAVFDSFGIKLMHGWLYDPQDTDTARVLRDCSYNELTQFISSEGLDDDFSLPIQSPLKAASKFANASPLLHGDSRSPVSLSALPYLPSSASASSIDVIDLTSTLSSTSLASVDDPEAKHSENSISSSLSSSDPTPSAEPSSSECVASPSGANDAFVFQPMQHAKPISELSPVTLSSAFDAPPSNSSSSIALSSITSAPSASSSAETSMESTELPVPQPFIFRPQPTSTHSKDPILSPSTELDRDHKVAKRENDRDIARRFLADSMSQMTIFGLMALHENIRLNEIVILFHNNHFSVLRKTRSDPTDSEEDDDPQSAQQGSLFELVTDIRIIDEQPLLAWSRLGSTDNDVLFVDAFHRIPHAHAQQAAREFNSQRQDAHQQALRQYHDRWGVYPGAPGDKGPQSSLRINNFYPGFIYFPKYAESETERANREAQQRATKRQQKRLQQQQLTQQPRSNNESLRRPVVPVPSFITQPQHIASARDAASLQPQLAPQHHDIDSDEAIARRFQEEENRLAREADARNQRSRAQQQQQQRRREDDDGCIIC